MSIETEDIKSRLNVVDVVGEYVRLQKAGANFKGLCPFHNEKSPSFTVNEEKQIFHCFGCSKGGDIFEFMMEMEGMDFREALKTLAEKAGVELSKTYTKKEGGESKDRSLEILDLATKFYQKQLLDGEGKKRALPYLLDRGLSIEFIKHFQLGYVPQGWNTIEQFLTGRGYTSNEIQKTGLLVQKDPERSSGGGGSRRYDRFRDRIMFPITDVLGRIIGYSARTLPGEDEAQAKYINTPETSIYHKSKVLYGIAQAKQAIKQTDEVLIVEGNMDVVALHQAGFSNAVAVSGTAMTQEHVQILKRYTHNVVLFFDMDEAGQAAAKKSAMLGFQNDMNVSVISLDGGKDAAELAKEDPEALKKAVHGKKNAMEYFLQVLSGRYDMQKPEDKKKMATEALEFVRAFGNEVERDEWIKRIAEQLESSVESVVSMYKSIVESEGKWAQKAVQEESPLETTLQGRAEMFSDQIAGIMMSSAGLWKKGMEIIQLLTEEDRKYLELHPLLAKVLSSGEQCGYEYEQFRTMLEGGHLQKKAQQLYFQNKYQEANESDMIEVAQEDLERVLQNDLQELKKERIKDQLNQLISDIKKSEQSGDKAAKEEFSRQFSLLTQQLNT